jgi:hypothetical protein
MVNSGSRIPIPKGVQNEVLLANRHACCVCQKPGVQLHHIDGNPSNNIPTNIATLCLDHHDMASMQLGLTKKLQPQHIHQYKMEWEKRCRADIQALSRKRFTFYYCIYKNPPRLLEAYRSLSDFERRSAIERIKDRLHAEQGPKTNDQLFGLNAVPQIDGPTLEALKSVYAGEMRPGYLGTFKPHPADPNYSIDCSTQEAMLAYHRYDLWCQIMAQTLAEARGTIPVEDLFQFETEEDLDNFVGSLVNFQLSIRGKGIEIPSRWKECPVGSVEARLKGENRIYRVRMQLRTMYLFSDTAAINLRRGRISGIGIFNGAFINNAGEVE